MATADHPLAFLAGQLADVEAGFSLGTFGAIAEFTRDIDEPTSFVYTDEMVGVVTGRGGLRLARHPEMRLIASESSTTEAWSHRVALCLPRPVCAMSGRTELTEIGADIEALRNADCGGVLFDLGLGTLQVDVCIRSADAQITAALRERAGKSIFAPNNDAMRIILAASPHRVFLSQIGRAEVFQPIPPVGGRSPTGPHTHLLPKLLAGGQTHAATEPLPEGWIPCAHVFPPHPLRDQLGRKRPFQRDYHDAFQTVLERCGDKRLVALKQDVISAVTAGHGPSTLTLPDDRFARATVRVALRQLQALQSSSQALADWLANYDRTPTIDDRDPMEALH